MLIPQAGDKVIHPLWPELGIGDLKSINTGYWTYCTGVVHWPTGQVSAHALRVLRVVDR